MTSIVAILDDRKAGVVQDALNGAGYDLSVIISGDFNPQDISGNRKPDLVIVDRYPTYQRGPSRTMNRDTVALDAKLQQLILATIRGLGVPFVIAGSFPNTGAMMDAILQDKAQGYIPAARPLIPEKAAYIRGVVAYALGQGDYPHLPSPRVF